VAMMVMVMMMVVMLASAQDTAEGDTDAPTETETETDTGFPDARRGGKKSGGSRCMMTDAIAMKIEKQWKAAFSSSSLLPVIGLPSNNNGVMTLTHQMGTTLLTINGLSSYSPLSNNALYSVECSSGHYLNLYEIMIPDIPGNNGTLSTAEMYVNMLRDNGLDVAGVHFHWWGSHLLPGDRGIIAIHHQKIDMNPTMFTANTIKAIISIGKVIKQRTGLSM